MINCVGCLFKPYINLSSIGSCPPIRVKCVHINNRAYAPRFSISRIFIMLTVLIILFQSTCLYLQVCEIFGQQNRNEVKLLTFFVEKTISGKATLFYAGGVLNYKIVLIELNGIAYIVENCKHYGISCFITKEIIRASKIIYYLNLVFLFGALLYIFIFTFPNNEDIDYFNIIMQCLYRFFYFFINITMGYQLAMHGLFYVALFRSCFNQIKKVLSEKSGQFHLQTNQTKEEISLKQLHRLYLALKIVHKNFTCSLKIIMILWLLLSIVALVLDSFAIVLTVTSHQELDYYLIFGSYVNIFGVILFLAVTQTVTNVVSAI